MQRNILLLFCFLFLGRLVLGQTPLIVDAGPDVVICPGIGKQIGGAPAASGGVPPYTYTWQPSSMVTNANTANPFATVTGVVEFTLTAMDAIGNKLSDVMQVKEDDIAIYDAGSSWGYCVGQQPGYTIGNTLNSGVGHSYSWTPAASVDNPNSPNPLASPTVTTTYTVVISVTTMNCPNKFSYVTVEAWYPPLADAGHDTTIREGDEITLHGSGGHTYYWGPDYNIRYINTSHPDVYPVVDTTYQMFIWDIHGCYSKDTVRITVIPGSDLFFYNTFTPNNDGENDFFFIGNVEKFPNNSLKIFNRYGLVVFSAHAYDNSWNGSYLGNTVPTGTYFYIFDPGDGSKKYNGSVTILR